MNCIRCGRQAGYNRVVVDTVSGHRIGGFCRNCEFSEFGRALERFNRTDDLCVVCNRDGHFALAVWSPMIEDGGQQLVSTVEYDITERTPSVCDEHFHALADHQGDAESSGRVSR